MCPAHGERLYLSIELALPLGDLGVGEVEFVLSIGASDRLLVQGGADGVELELNLVELGLELRAFLNLSLSPFQLKFDKRRKALSASCVTTAETRHPVPNGRNEVSS